MNKGMVSIKEKRPIVFTIYLLLPILFLFFAGCKEEEKAEVPEPIKPVKLLTVQTGEQKTQMSLPGRVRAARRSELSFKVAGPLEALPINEGQVVKKGDLVAQILPRDFELAVDEAKAREREAEQQFQRYKELYSKRQVSKAEFDRYRAARDVTRAELENTQNALKDTKLLAPFDGVISKRYVENFEKVQEKQPIANLQQIGELEVLIDVPELMMASFRESGKVTVTAEFDAVAGASFPLIVKEYSTDADPATQTYQVVLTMDQPEEANILPGMTAKVNAVAAEGASATGNILIPAIAVLNDAENTNIVWRFDPDSQTVQSVEVQVASLEGSANIEVTEGLNSGDEIVVAGVTKLRDGMKVRPWEKQREGK